MEKMKVNHSFQQIKKDRASLRSGAREQMMATADKGDAAEVGSESMDSQEMELVELVYSMMCENGIASQLRGQVAGFLQGKGVLGSSARINASRANVYVLSLIYEYLQWVGMTNSCTTLLSESPVELDASCLNDWTKIKDENLVPALCKAVKLYEYERLKEASIQDSKPSSQFMDVAGKMTVSEVKWASKASQKNEKLNPTLGSLKDDESKEKFGKELSSGDTEHSLLNEKPWIESSSNLGSKREVHVAEIKSRPEDIPRSIEEILPKSAIFNSSSNSNSSLSEPKTTSFEKKYGVPLTESEEQFRQDEKWLQLEESLEREGICQKELKDLNATVEDEKFFSINEEDQEEVQDKSNAKQKVESLFSKSEKSDSKIIDGDLEKDSCKSLSDIETNSVCDLFSDINGDNTEDFSINSESKALSSCEYVTTLK